MGAIPRPRLEQRLTDASQGPLTLLIGGAGYGKTTLLAGWARTCRLPVAWLSLDAADDDPWRLASHLAAAIQRAAPGAATGLTDLIGGTRGGDPATVAAVLADDLLDLPTDLVLVLDDLHAVPGRGATTLLDALMEYPPPALHVVASARTPDAAPEVRRLRSLGQVAEIQERDLRFRLAEIEELWSRQAPLTAEEIERRTAGWAAGVRALALSRAGAALPDSIHRYLAQDVLAGQPAELVAFLRGLAVAERVTPALAAAMSGDRGPAEAAAMLEEAERAGLFVARLDDAGTWWSLHPLLRDVLLAGDAGSDAVVSAHLRASSWFANHGMIHEAITHAVEAGSPEAAADLLASDVDLVLGDRHPGSLDWIDLLPPATVRERPALLIARARTLMSRSSLSAAEAALADAEALLSRRDAARTEAASRALRWEILAIRGSIANIGGDPTALVDDLRELLPGPPGSHPAQRCDVVGVWSMAMALLGRGGEARDALEALAAIEGSAPTMVAAHLWMAVAALFLRDADLAGAAPWLDRAPSVAGPDTLRARQWLAVLVTVARHERGDVPGAVLAAEAGLPLAPGEFVTAKTVLAGRLARALLALGRVDAARAVAERDRRRLELSGAGNLLPAVDTLDAEIALAAGDIDAAGRWADSEAIAFAPDALRFGDHAAQAQARIWLARGGPGDSRSAVRVLERLREHELAVHHRLSLARTLPLLAAAHAAVGDGDAAAATMREALDIEPGAMTQRFADAGDRALDLLRAVAATPGDPLSERAERIVGALERGRRRTPAGRPPCPLTARELDIARLMAQWLTNKEIADRLGISVATVSEHVRNILRKMDVGDRRSAVIAGVEAGWLGPGSSPPAGPGA